MKEQLLLKLCMEDKTLLNKVKSYNIREGENKFTDKILTTIYNLFQTQENITCQDLYVKLDTNNKDYDEQKLFVRQIEKSDTNIGEGTKQELNDYVKKLYCETMLFNQVNDGEKGIDISKYKDIYQDLHNFNIFENNDNNEELMSISEFMKIDIPERKLLLSPGLKERTITIINASKGVGKTQFAGGIVSAVSKGLYFNNGKGYENKCLILDGELSAEELQERIPPHRLNKNVYLRSVIYKNDRKNYPGLLLNENYRRLIENICLKNDIKLLVLDNKKSLSPGIEENSSYEWDIINEGLLELRGKGISIILVTHAGKDASRGVRGHSTIEDNVDYTITLTDKKLNNDYVRFTYKFDKVRGLIKYSDIRPLTMTFKPDEDNMFEGYIEDDEDIIIDYIKSNPDKSGKEIAQEFGISQSKVTRIKKKID